MYIKLQADTTGLYRHNNYLALKASLQFLT